MNAAKIELLAKLIAASMKAAEDAGFIKTAEDAEKWLLRCAVMAKIEVEAAIARVK
jgi:hypothetical protein